MLKIEDEDNVFSSHLKFDKPIFNSVLTIHNYIVNLFPPGPSFGQCNRCVFNDYVLTFK